MKKIALVALVAFIGLSAFVVKRKTKLKLSDDFVLIPAGTMYLNRPENNFSIDSSTRISIQSFYISRYEITNLQYRQFCTEVVSRLTETEKSKVACDTAGWRETSAYCEPMVQQYYRHPAYNNYPVVNISYDGAMAYCKWLQQKIQAQNPEFEISVSLPEKPQWVWAAQGGRSQAMYPWGNYYLRNKKGEFMCNFKRVGDQAIYRNRQTGKPEVMEPSAGAVTGGLNDRAFYTAEVKSFYPNDWGLYNMCGNAAEMITEKGIAVGGSWNDYGGDVHIRSQAEYSKPLPTIGFRPVIVVKERSK